MKIITEQGAESREPRVAGGQEESVVGGREARGGGWWEIVSPIAQELHCG